MKKFYLIEFLIISGLTAVIFSNNLINEFVYDDSAFVKNNPHITKFSFIPKYFTNVKTYQSTGIEGKVKIYRPLVTVSYAVDYAVWKLNPFGYHLVNNMLHLICGFLVFLFFYQWSGSRKISLITSILFISHPAQIEAVSWISGRGNMLYSIFALASLLFYLKCQINNTINLIIPLILFAISLFCKEMGINVIFISALIYLYAKKETSEVSMRKFIKFFSSMIIIGIFYFVIRYSVLSAIAQTTYIGGSITATIFTMIKVLCLYLLLFLFPVNLNVIPDVSVITSFFSAELLISIAFFTLFFIIVIINRKNQVSFGLLWGVLGLLPVMNIIPIQALMAERFLYLSNAGFCFTVAVIIIKIAKNKTIFIVTSTICIFSALSIVRNSDWQNNFSLWKSSLSKNYYSAKAHNGLALEYQKRGEINAAISEFQTAMALDRENIQIINNYAIALKLSGDDVAFTQKLQDALKLKGEHSQTYHNLGLYYLEKGEYEKSLMMLTESIRLDWDNANTYNSIAICYAHLNNEDKAIFNWLKAYKLMPIWTEPYYNIVIYYIKNNDFEKARRYLDEALKIFPDKKEFTNLKYKLNNCNGFSAKD